MEKELYLIQKTLEMTQDQTCCDELKAAAQKWLAARGTDGETAAWEGYLAELRADVMPLSDVLAFSGSPEAEKLFGADFARGLHAHYLEVEAGGGKYCDCPACSAAMKILETVGTPLE